MGRHQVVWAWALACLLAAPGPGRGEEPVSLRRPFRFAGGEAVSIIWYRDPIGQFPVTTEQQVTLEGLVSAPAGGAVSIINLTLQEATDAVAARVQSATGLKNALVWLAVKSVPVHRVYVEGEVVRPEAVLLPQDHDLTLAAALALVGGPSEDADLTQLKLVREEAGGKRRIFVVDGSVLLMRGSGEVGPVLKPGDLIVVPRAESFTVTGEISKVGVYSRKDTRVAQGQPIRLSHAIAAAGGVKPLADRQVVRIIRTDEQGRRLVLVCDLEAAVEKGDLTQDAVLQDGDQILVPAHEGILLMGRVAASGIYYPVGGPMTVSRLLAMGGGFTSYAKRNAVLVIRKDTPAQPIRVDMKLIMEEGRGDLDITLKPGDMVFVGGEAPL